MMEAHSATTGRTGIFIVDDHPMVRHGLRQVIEDEPDLFVCGEAKGPTEALAGIVDTSPALITVDLALGETNGLDFLKELRVRFPQLPALVLSMLNETFYAERALRAGARGYLNKTDAPAKVVAIIRRVLGGEVCVSERLASRLLDQHLTGKRDAHAGFHRLSDRELQVFALIGEGLSTREIAVRLHLSVKTIESHRGHIKEKLKLADSAELLKNAIRWLQAERPG